MGTKSTTDAAGGERSLWRDRRNRRRGEVHHRRYRGRLSRLLHELRGVVLRYGRAGACSERTVSAKTRRERRVTMRRMLVDLHAQGLKIRHLRNFGSRHAVGVLRNWEKLGLKSSTLSTYVSHLRTFVTWIGKAELVPVIDRFCADRPGFTHRRTATEKDKSARGAAVEPAEILRRARQTGDQHFVCQLLLVMSLGLRARESWRFRPHLADRPGYLLITEGTKGGRPRTLPAPSTATQSAVLERAKALVPYGASMIPAHYRRVAQWASRFYKLCRQIGLTREGLGVTTHSLRHDVLLDLFAEIAGEPAPVRREGDSHANSHRVQVAREVVAQHAGHSRTSVTSAYLGSRRRNPRGQRSQGAEELPSPRSVKIAVSSPDTVSSEPERSEVLPKSAMTRTTPLKSDFIPCFMEGGLYDPVSGGEVQG